MKALYDWLTSINPVNATEVIRQLLYVGLAFELLNWTDSQLAIVLSAASAMLSLFTRSATVANARIEEKVDAKVAQREMVGTTGTGDGMAPNTKTGTGTRPRP